MLSLLFLACLFSFSFLSFLSFFLSFSFFNSFPFFLCLSFPFSYTALLPFSPSRYVMFIHFIFEIHLKNLRLELHKKAIHIKQFHKSVGPSPVLSVSHYRLINHTFSLRCQSPKCFVKMLASVIQRSLFILK